MSLKNIARRALPLALTILLFTSFIATSGILTKVQASGPTYTTHDVIRIDSNAQLASVSSSGSGTASDPYVIQGFDIDATGYNHGIYIGNTSVDLVIQECHLHGAQGAMYPYVPSAGITLNNVTNCIIRANNCSGNSAGILLMRSSDNVLEKNNCSSNFFYGIQLSNGSDNNTIENNTCDSNGFIGMSIGSSGNTIENNTCDSNSYAGIHMYGGSENNIIESNTCNSNEHGIYLESSNDNLLENNAITSSADYGIYLFFCSGNSIYGNILINNHGTSATHDPSCIQAYDNYYDFNLWNSSSYGNYWSDWTSPDIDQNGIVDSPYLIDGGPGKDHYPLVRMSPPYVTIESPLNGTVVNTSTVVVTGTASPNYTLEVNGMIAYVNYLGNFSITVPLTEGANRITAISKNVRFQTIDSIFVTYVDSDGATISVLNQQLNDTRAQLNDSIDQEAITAQLLSITRQWLQHVNDLMNSSYHAQNLKADQVSLLLVQVDEMQGLVRNVSESLNSTIDGYGFANDQIAELQGDLNATSADLATAKASLLTIQANLRTTQNDATPLLVGWIGAISTLVVIAVFGFVYLRRRKLP